MGVIEHLRQPDQKWVKRKNLKSVNNIAKLLFNEKIAK